MLTGAWWPQGFIMRPTTKLFRSLNSIQAHFRKKSQLFEHSFVSSTFFLFFGFMCGNLFGTFLSFFRASIPWDGAIIALILLFVEWVNYLNFVIFNKPVKVSPRPFYQKKTIGSRLMQLILIIPKSFDKFRLLFDSTTKKNVFQNQWTRFFKAKLLFFQRKQKALIRLLNFYKLGLLLGFFIDAFKVGS